MAYAEVEDVEGYIGYTLDEEEQAALELFLEDFSDFIDAEILSKGKDPTLVEESRKKSVTVRHGARFAVNLGRDSTIVQQSRTAGDVNSSVTYRAALDDDEALYTLKRSEKLLLGIGSSGFTSWVLEPNWRP